MVWQGFARAKSPEFARTKTDRATRGGDDTPQSAYPWIPAARGDPRTLGPRSMSRSGCRHQRTHPMSPTRHSVLPRGTEWLPRGSRCATKTAPPRCAVATRVPQWSRYASKAALQSPPVNPLTATGSNVVATRERLVVARRASRATHHFPVRQRDGVLVSMSRGVPSEVASPPDSGDSCRSRDERGRSARR